MSKVFLLASGVGARMGDAGKDIPKSLIHINNKPIIEYTIENMINSGNIEHIFMAVGFKKESFYYLPEKYPQIKFEFIENPHYKTINNIYPFLQFLDGFSKEHDKQGIFVVEADVLVGTPHVFRNFETNTMLVTLRDCPGREWLITPHKGTSLIKDVRVVEDTYNDKSQLFYCGVAYISPEQWEIFRNRSPEFKKIMDANPNTYWDDLWIDAIRRGETFNFNIADKQQVYEFDNQDDINRFNPTFVANHNNR